MQRDLAARYPKSGREPETARHFEWFVEVQVCGRSPAEVARSEDVDRTTVDSAWRQICKRLGVTPRSLLEVAPIEKESDSKHTTFDSL